MVKMRCVMCNSEFETEQKYVNRGHGKFCSKSCSSRYGVVLRGPGGVEVECVNCSKAIRRKKNLLDKVKNFFCSKKCKSSYERKSGYTSCLNCNKKLIYDRSNRQKKYCSFECQNQHAHKRYIIEWKNGARNGGGESVSAHVRKYLFEKYDSKCRKCGWSKKNPVTGLVPLTTNHMNGDPYDHREENLELICPNCHSLTPNYGGLNVGNGRRKRAERIREYKKFAT